MSPRKTSGPKASGTRPAASHGVAAAGTGYQIGPETWVELEAEVRDADGELVAGSEAPLEFVFGLGQVLPAIERELEGGVVGLERTVHLQADAAYGERDESLIRAVAREEFPADVQEGDRFELEDAHGTILVVRVLAVDPDEIQVDFNHPLAGQAVSVQVKVLAVRPARETEIAAAERALGQFGVQSTPLVAPESLLRASGRRYEKAPPGQAVTSEPNSGSAIEEKKP
jgi:FKBP-type peptidyl-prolyl cis-trans isomerase SlyD